MKIKAWLSALLVGGLVTASSAVARPTYNEQETVQDHIEILNTLDEMGIDVQVNNALLCSGEESVSGFWFGARKLFALCQESIRKSENPVYTGAIFLASDDDLDTIRHEAHHVIQDCMDGKIDGSLKQYFSPENYVTFMKGFDEWRAEYIRKVYKEAGETPQVIELEVEAWAVADLVSADMIHTVLKRECEV